MNLQTTTVDGIPMRWHEEGSGVPVILVHGIPASPALWRHVLPRIRGARCLAFEMVGYGASIPEGRDRDISVARQADYLFAPASAIRGIAEPRQLMPAVLHPAFSEGG